MQGEKESAWMEVAENDAVKVDGRSIMEQQGRKHSEAVGEGEWVLEVVMEMACTVVCGWRMNEHD